MREPLFKGYEIHRAFRGEQCDSFRVPMVVELAPPLSVAFACIDDFHGRGANKQTCEIKEKTWLPNGMGD